jgi:hypothetical protein
LGLFHVLLSKSKLKTTTSLFYCFILSSLILPNKCIAQISGSFEGIYGKEKTMISLTVDKKINDLIHFGGILKTGSLKVFDYPDFEYDYSGDDVISNNTTLSEYTFPYNQMNGRFAGGSTKTTGISLGGYLSLNRSLSRSEKDWFFVRFDLEYLFLMDRYDLKWSQIEYVGLEKEETIISDRGEYVYHAAAIATRAGYQRFFDKKDRLFAQANIGACYYHPLYPNDKFSGYGIGAPFMGVEFEAGLGIGYVIKQR